MKPAMEKVLRLEFKELDAYCFRPGLPDNSEDVESPHANIQFEAIMTSLKWCVVHGY
jgi:hypothetical protein